MKAFILMLSSAIFLSNRTKEENGGWWVREKVIYLTEFHGQICCSIFISF